MNTLSVILNSILIVAYVVGVIITIHFQNRKIDALKTQLDAQSGILAQMERFMNIFKLDVVEQYVEINRKTFQLEKEEAIKKANEEWKAKAEKDKNLLSKELDALFMFAVSITFVQPSNPHLSRLLKEMDDSYSKRTLIAALRGSLEKWNKFLTNKTD